AARTSERGSVRARCGHRVRTRTVGHGHQQRPGCRAVDAASAGRLCRLPPLGERVVLEFRRGGIARPTLTDLQNRMLSWMKERMAPPDTAPSTSGVRVLIVDDEEPVRKFITRVLSDAGFQTKAAASGREAIDLAS